MAAPVSFSRWLADDFSVAADLHTRFSWPVVLRCPLFCFAEAGEGWVGMFAEIQHGSVMPDRILVQTRHHDVVRIPHHHLKRTRVIIATIRVVADKKRKVVLIGPDERSHVN